MDLIRVYRAADIPDDMPLASKASDPVGMKWDIDALSALCAEQGREALSGKSGPLLDAAVLGAALVMWHTGKERSLSIAADRARAVIASGEALQRLDAGL